MSQEATLAAAVIAAGFSLANVAITLIAQRAAEFRSAHREAMVPFFSRLADAIHQTVALSDLALKAKTQETFKRKYREAREAAEQLKEIRREARYGLWEIEKAVRDLTRLPDWLAHLHAYPRMARRLFRVGAALAEAVDRTVVRSYLRGKPPTLRRRIVVRYRAAQFRRRRARFMKTPQEKRR